MRTTVAAPQSGGAGPSWGTSLRLRRGAAPASVPTARIQSAPKGSSERSGEHSALPLSQCSYLLHLADLVAREELPAPGAAPAPLAHQQVSYRPATRLPRGIEDDFSCGHVTFRDPSLQLRTREPDLVGPLQSAQSLRLQASSWRSPSCSYLSPCVLSAEANAVDDSRPGTTRPAPCPTGAAIRFFWPSNCRCRPTAPRSHLPPIVTLARSGRPPLR